MDELDKIRIDTEVKLKDAQEEFNSALTGEQKKYYMNKIEQIQLGLIYINSKIIIAQNKEILKRLK